MLQEMPFNRPNFGAYDKCRSIDILTFKFVAKNAA